MNVYKIVLNTKKKFTEKFPLNNNGVSLNDISMLKIESERLKNRELFYEGQLTNKDFVVLTIGLYAINPRFLNSIKDINGLEYIKVYLVNTKTAQKEEFYILRPKRYVEDMVNDMISKSMIMAKGRPNEYKSYLKIGLSEKKLAHLPDEIFKIKEEALGIYIKETVKKFFSQFDGLASYTPVDSV